MAKKQFQAESKRLLDLMIHSIYTNREIFLREVISNASDAIDKRYFKEIEAGNTGLGREDFEIRLTPNKENRTLTISDNGIGMTAEELENNLGIIANSGSLQFKTDNADSEIDTDIIGQFGVGFYSLFMVAKRIDVISRAYGSEQAYRWTSEGADGFEIEADTRDEVGTDVILTLRDDEDEDKYSDFLEEYRLRSLVRKYSDYIRYPIVMNCQKRREVEATEEEKAKEDYKPAYETYFEDERLNSMVPLWKKKKNEISEEEYNSFYKDNFFDWNDPLKVIHTNVEGLLSYDALLYIPSAVPFNFYTKDYQRGLRLYSSGVMIMEKCEDLLPDYLGFINGLVDSEDLSLNISREMLQQNRQLMAIAQRLEKKILETLKDMLSKDRDTYLKFFENFGIQLKYGMYEEYGRNKDKLKDLVLWRSSTTGEMTTLSEYVSRMASDQKYIYYTVGETKEKLLAMPQMDLFREKGYEVLLCTDEIDEFALMMLGNYEEKEFRNIAGSDLGLEQSEEEKKEMEEKTEAAKELLAAVKEALGDRVSSVILSSRLKNHAVCFAAAEGLSLEMEKILKAQAALTGQADPDEIKADKILELNSEHPAYQALARAFEAGETETVKDYAFLLYDQALLIEGMPIDDPNEFSERICRLMK